MKKKGIVNTSSRLKHLKAKMDVLTKASTYLSKELSKVREKEAVLRKKISKEKKAISLVNRAKRLR